MFIAIRPLSKCSKELSTLKLGLKRKERAVGCVFVRHFQEFHSKLNKKILKETVTSISGYIYHPHEGKNGNYRGIIL
jgi:hypothetical protein